MNNTIADKKKYWKDFKKQAKENKDYSSAALCSLFLSDLKELQQEPQGWDEIFFEYSKISNLDLDDVRYFFIPLRDWLNKYYPQQEPKGLRWVQVESVLNKYFKIAEVYHKAPKKLITHIKIDLQLELPPAPSEEAAQNITQ